MEKDAFLELEELFKKCYIEELNSDTEKKVFVDMFYQQIESMVVSNYLTGLSFKINDTFSYVKAFMVKIGNEIASKAKPIILKLIDKENLPTVSNILIPYLIKDAMFSESCVYLNQIAVLFTKIIIENEIETKEIKSSEIEDLITCFEEINVDLINRKKTIADLKNILSKL